MRVVLLSSYFVLSVCVAAAVQGKPGHGTGHVMLNIFCFCLFHCSLTRNVLELF